MFENERIISFIPPDGNFELLSYRLDVKVRPLFTVDVIIERPSKTKIEFMIKAKSNFKQKSTANNVSIYIPVPDDAERPEFKCTFGSAEYVPDKDNSMCWSLKQFPG